MISTLRSILFIIIAGLLSGTVSIAQTGEHADTHALSDRIATAHRSGTDFREIALFAPATADKHAFLGKETILQPLGEQILNLYNAHPQAISLALRTDDGQQYRLELLQTHPTSEQANMGYIDASGRHKVSFSEGVHYQGNVAGTEQSMAALSIFANGDVMLLFANGDGNFVLGKLEDGSGKYILYNDRDMKGRPDVNCAVSDYPTTKNNIQDKSTKTSKSLLCNKVKLYWEVGFDVFSSKTTLANTQNYIIGLFNQFQAMYANERIAMELKSMYIWTVQDDIPNSASSAALYKFRGYWNQLGNGFDGDLAHVITMGTLGGVAFLDVLCNRQNAYGFSDIQGSFSTVPTYSWDVEVITHETGHNLGSQHTHWCGWMTGSGGTCGSIDNCTTQETTSGCSSCGATNLNSASTTAWKGTVMSYCHLVARGINLANGFGTLPGNLIRNKVSASSCLSNIITATVTPTPICTNNGAVSLVYAVNNTAAAPYTYLWSNGVKTQNLSSITVPGNYSVQVTDSNGCSAAYNADVIRMPNPGNGIVPTQAMPICCNNAPTPLTLKATAPKDITTCQSIYWIKSSVALGSFTIAKGYFDTTAVANILPSTNAGNITGGATVDIKAPASCAAKQTWYYTPIVVNLPHAADSFTASSSTNTAFNNNGTRIGSYVSLPDQTSLPTACDVLDTPIRQSLAITVTNYTGRANNMRITIQDASGQVVVAGSGLPGNGTYTVIPSGFPGSLLQYMKITAFDFNCTVAATGAATCTSSNATVSAARNVVYGARPFAASPGCVAGTSIKVDFAPSGCAKLAVENAVTAQSDAMMLYPNPASKSATLQFTTTHTGTTQLKVTDMLGKTILVQEAIYSRGQHQQKIDVHAWAKGVYFVNVNVAGQSAERLKLVVE